MICERFKNERLKIGLNQVEFAKIFNVTKQTVSNWESGKRKPDSEMIRKIAEYFGVTTDYLLGAENNNAEQEDPITDKQVDELWELFEQLDDNNKELVMQLINNLIDARK